MLAVYDVVREVELLETAASLGCPVPRVLFHRETNGEDRGFYGMELIEGDVPLASTVDSFLPTAEQRTGVGAEVVRLMARMHSVSPDNLHIRCLGSPPLPTATGLADLAAIRANYEEHVPMRQPLLDLAFAWLEHNASAVSGRVAFVHNDLRVGNLMVRDDHVAAILDWETATLTDPASDLAKFALPPFRGPSGLASGLISQEDLLSQYEDEAGWRPTKETLQYWTVLSLTRTVVVALRTVADFALGTTADVRFANLRNRTRSYVDCLVELFGQWGH